MGVAGRKSWTEEMNMAQRYSDLTEPFFKYLKQCLNGKDHAKKKWAVEQIGKAFVKMIPQQLDGNPEKPLILNFDSSFKNGTTSSTKRNSKKSS